MQCDKVGNYVSLSTHQMNKWPKSLESVHPCLPEGGAGWRRALAQFMGGWGWRMVWGSTHQAILVLKRTYREPVEEGGSEPLFCQGAEVESALSASHVPLFGFHGNLCLWGNYRHVGYRQTLLISDPHHLQNAPLGVGDELILLSSSANAGEETNHHCFRIATSVLWV